MDQSILRQIRNTSAIGDTCEAMVLAAALKAGRIVLLPFGHRLRYDLVLEDASGKFLRVQCKSARLVNGAIRFNTSSVHKKSNGQVLRRDYTGEADYFGVYCAETGKVYLVPVGEVPKGIAYLRFSPARSGRQKGTRPAAIFELK